jgi:hypothetical protein
MPIAGTGDQTSSVANMNVKFRMMESTLGFDRALQAPQMIEWE